MLELIIGALPVAGDLFDFAFEANERNVRLLEARMGLPEQGQALVIGLVALVVAGLSV